MFLLQNVQFLATEELSLGGVKFITYDLGGHKQGKFDTVNVKISKIFASRML